MNEDKKYLGTGWTFPPQFRIGGIGKGAVMVSLDEDIEQSLQILFSTPLGQRVFRYDFGHTLKRWVFHGMDLSTRTLMEDSIRQTIVNHEPRISIDHIHIHLSEGDEGVVNIHLQYTVRKTNTRSNMVFPFYLKEGTNL